MPESGISIVIPAYNEEKYLPACLASVKQARQRFTNEIGLKTEVIVVDNVSTDKTAEIAQSLGVLVVSEPKRIIACVRNAGIRATTLPIVLTLDADSTIEAAGLVKIWQAMQDDQVIGGSFNVRFNAKKLWVRIIARILQYVVYLAWRIFGGMFFFRRSIALEIGGFPEQHMVAEDAMFAKALRTYAKKNGKKFVLLRSVRILTADRKDNSLGNLLPTLLQSFRSLSGKKVSTKDLSYWYHPKR